MVARQVSIPKGNAFCRYSLEEVDVKVKSIAEQVVRNNDSRDLG
jgi:hypothetical protein